MSTRKIASSTLWQLLSQGVAVVLGIISIKLVTVALSPALVGNYQTVYAYLQIFGILADFGLYAVAVRELTRAEDKHLALAALFLLRACITFLSLGAAILLGFFLFRGTPLPLGIAIASFVPFFILLGGMYRAAFQAEYRMREVFIAEFLSKVIPVLLMASLVFSSVRESAALQDYHLFLLFGVAGSLAFFLAILIFARSLSWFDKGLSEVFHYSRKEVLQEFARFSKFAMPYGLAFLMTTIYRQSDITLIAILRSDYEIQNAYYGVAMRLAEVGFLLPTLVMNSVLPSIALEDSNLRSPFFLGKVLFSLLVLGSVVSLTAFFWAKPLILLVSHESYVSDAFGVGAERALMLLSVSIFLSMLITYFFYVLLLVHAWERLLLATSIAAFLSVVLNLFLIPPYGFIGAGMTSILAHTFLAISLAGLTIMKMPVCLRFAQVYQWFAFSLTYAVFLYFTTPLLQNEFLTILFGFIAPLLALVLAKLYQLFPGKP